MYPYIHILGREVGTYGVCMLLGIALVVVLAIFRGKKRGVIAEDILIVGAFALGLALIGGSLLFALVTYSPSQISAFVRTGDFRFLSSGIVFYGGLIGGILGALLGQRIVQCKFDSVERVIVPLIPLGHAIGRIGCVLAGCCHGYAYDGPLALYYPDSVLNLSPIQGYFPIQPIESVVNLGICLFLLWFERKKNRTTRLLFVYLTLYGVSRFVLEMFRGDAIRGVWHTLSTSQIISIILVAVSIAGMLYQRSRIRKAPLG